VAPDGVEPSFSSSSLSLNVKVIWSRLAARTPATPPCADVLKRTDTRQRLRHAGMRRIVDRLRPCGGREMNSRRHSADRLDTGNRRDVHDRRVCPCAVGRRPRVVRRRAAERPSLTGIAASNRAP
jgi:hypothetical protein